MQRTAVSKLLRKGAQIRPFSSKPTSSLFHQIPKSVRPSLQFKAETVSNQIRPFSISLTAQKGLSPDSEDPKPKEAEPHAIDAAPVELSNEQYNQLSDDYIDAIVSKLEELQEEREDVDVEYSVRLPSSPFLIFLPYTPSLYSFQPLTNNQPRPVS